MRFARAHLLIAARIALLAMLMVAFAPTVSRMLAPAGQEGAVWAELCTGAGIEYVMLAGEADSDEHTHVTPSSDHCPYCKVNGGAPVLAGVGDLTLLWLPPARDPLPRAFLFAPRVLHAWSAAYPRAPPLVS